MYITSEKDDVEKRMHAGGSRASCEHLSPSLSFSASEMYSITNYPTFLPQMEAGTRFDTAVR